MASKTSIINRGELLQNLEALINRASPTFALDFEKELHKGI